MKCNLISNGIITILKNELAKIEILLYDSSCTV